MHVAYCVAWSYLSLITGSTLSAGWFSCPIIPKLNFAASPFQQETSDDGEYFSTEIFDFKLQFGIMIGLPSLPGILQTRPRIDAVQLLVAYSMCKCDVTATNIFSEGDLKTFYVIIYTRKNNLLYGKSCQSYTVFFSCSMIYLCPHACLVLPFFYVYIYCI